MYWVGLCVHSPAVAETTWCPRTQQAHASPGLDSTPVDNLTSAILSCSKTVKHGSMATAGTIAPKDMAASLDGCLTSLKENLAVLEILDSNAEGWPGVHASMEAMQAATSAIAAMLLAGDHKAKHAMRESVESSKELQLARKQADQLTNDIEKLRKELEAKTDSLLQLERQLAAAQRKLSGCEAKLQSKVLVLSLQRAAVSAASKEPV